MGEALAFVTLRRRKRKNLGKPKAFEFLDT